MAQIDEDHSSLAIVHDGKATPLKLGEDANLTVRAALAKKADAEVVFCGYGLSIPEYKFDDFAGLDLKGKIVVYIAGGPSDIPGNLRSHYSFRSERWKAIHHTGAIGVIAIPNPKAMDIPWERSTLGTLKPDDGIGSEFRTLRASNSARRSIRRMPSSSSPLPATLSPRCWRLADQGKPLPRFPLHIRLLRDRTDEDVGGGIAERHRRAARLGPRCSRMSMWSSARTWTIWAWARRLTATGFTTARWTMARASRR